MFSGDGSWHFAIDLAPTFEFVDAMFAFNWGELMQSIVAHDRVPSSDAIIHFLVEIASTESLHFHQCHEIEGVSWSQSVELMTIEEHFLVVDIIDLLLLLFGNFLYLYR